ncbi:hypothetical protein NUU61_001370 [Penicillium alfredii]|uniref:Myb-like domain-containing protein n=1 Tax=Penicillium alfredii TaxID=1506179 RepID=A0A9W9G4Y8_9EURO|nr:uncharacterized protein NUU61_001370 [Penicillium alfredii]KAJ5111740.1 hypothetical protein NUU61_001370 [Penicillium alfredii]
MANTRFRLGTFRQWNPFQDKAQPLHDLSNICRYPSPVSITATPPPSNASDTVSRAPNGHSLKAGKHPLPARPSVEVCMDSGLRSATQAPGLGPADSELVNQSSPTSNSDDPTQPREVCGGENIDPVILCDKGFTGTKQIRESESVSGVGSGQDLALAQGDSLSGSCASEVDSPSRLSQGAQGRATGSNEQNTQVGKRRSPGRKHTKKVSRRLPNSGTRHRKHPTFSTIHSQFMAMSVEGRLQFLSWLFEGALSHCVSVSPSTNAASSIGCSPYIDTEMACDRDHPNLGAEIADVQNAPSTRKGLLWSEEEGRLLVKLRDEQKLAWSELTEHFTREFPGRSKGSIQVYWSTKLKKERLSWSFPSD